MKTYVREKIALWSLTSALYVSLWSASWPGCFVPGETTPNSERLSVPHNQFEHWGENRHLDRITPWFRIHSAWYVVFKLNQWFWLLNNKDLSSIKSLEIDMITIMFMHCFCYIKRDPVQSHTQMRSMSIHVSSLCK
jgi:hypothetical protein